MAKISGIRGPSVAIVRSVAVDRTDDNERFAVRQLSKPTNGGVHNLVSTKQRVA